MGTGKAVPARGAGGNRPSKSPKFGKNQNLSDSDKKTFGQNKFFLHRKSTLNAENRLKFKAKTFFVEITMFLR